MNRAKLSLRVAVAILAFACTWTFGPPSAQAQTDTETWKISSSHPYTVQLEFYLQGSKPLRSWPGGGRAYTLNDSKVHEFTLRCQRGQQICYGAWDTGTGTPYWGVGRDNRYACTGGRACCWTCGMKGKPRTINLTR
jgi:hypothetical protein